MANPSHQTQTKLSASVGHGLVTVEFVKNGERYIRRFDLYDNEAKTAYLNLSMWASHNGKMLKVYPGRVS